MSDSSQTAFARIAIVSLAALVGLIASACCAWCKGDGPAGGNGVCITFDAQSMGTVYHVGDTFTDSGVDITLKPFQWTGGTWTSAGFAEIDVGAKAGGTGNSIESNNSNLAFDLGRVGGVTLKFGEYGGNLNIKVNGEFQNIGDFSALPATIGGTTAVATSSPGSDLGTLTLTGIIEVFEIGGQELWIDDVCTTPAP